jgi:protein-tyrosine phosphatase
MAQADAESSYAVDLLVVCTANQARSPVAEMLFRREAEARRGDQHGLVIRSAGLHAKPGARLLAAMVAAMDKRGLTFDDHRSRAVNVDELDASRLVITMTEEHRREVNRMLPAMVGRTYTLCEVDRLVSSELWQSTWDGADDAMERLQRLRPLVPKAPQAEDIADPAGHSVDLAVHILDEIVDRVTRVSHHLFGTVQAEVSA